MGEKKKKRILRVSMLNFKQGVSFGVFHSQVDKTFRIK